jgi:nucleoside-diphosphate-sugar epimerase
VGLLGMAFKPEVDDLRQSLSFRVKKVCRVKGAVVLCHDPCMTEGKGSVSLETLLERCDGIILCTPHETYRAIDFSRHPSRPVIDVWNFFPSSVAASKPDLLPGTAVIPSALVTQAPAPLADKPTVLVTGSAGFIGGYLVQELLQHGYRVLGVDNFTKYGKVEREYDSNPDYELHQGDAKDVELLKRLAERCDYVVACAAMIGGISYFHALAYDLLAENERIIAATFDAAIHAFKVTKQKEEEEEAAQGSSGSNNNAVIYGRLKKIIVLSSSMVFEQATTFPTPEGEQEMCAPPLSTYGFQKLACEYYAKGAWEQYQLPYTIVRPFNCVGVGERRALRRKAADAELEREEEVSSGTIKLAMSHVVPDLIQKLLKGQDPLHLLGDGKQVRHYTYGGDLARGIRLCIESPAALNNDFNISTAASTTVLELAELVWKKIHGDTKPFRWVSDTPFLYDVQRRIPDCRKAKEVLDYEATTTLSDILDELIPWIQQQIDLGNM